MMNGDLAEPRANKQWQKTASENYRTNDGGGRKMEERTVSND
jgi:hypothetical protein